MERAGRDRRRKEGTKNQCLDINPRPQRSHYDIRADDTGKVSSLQDTFKPIVFFWKLHSNRVL
jgi:hypothetical protein